ncbi:MAG: IS200/IS605 family element transposase accessory protein TnpB [Blastochloris sp.]|nr:IS200/IS605 family element transposase accessory protein TnpB [Blastochloris sp.]
MKVIAHIKLLPTPDQQTSLQRTLEQANAACNHISHVAWETRTFGKYALQKLVYHDVRDQFGLSAQVTVRCLAKVGDAYKRDTRTKRTFRPLVSIAYDDRILSFALPDSSLSIWTLAGRQSIPFVCGERQRQMLHTRQGESDLLFHRGDWYLLVTCAVEEPDPQDVDDVLGVDLGVTNIASDSDGTHHRRRMLNNVRYRQRRRTKLQKRGTKAARRRLKQLAGKERRFAKDVNHTISKRIVETAERTKRAMSLEDLHGIRTRVRARRQQRAQLHSWSFFQLRSCIGYKARRAGIPVVLVDPRNTSRCCLACGHTDKANRPNQSTFRCVSCGCAGHADTIAAENMRVLGRAAVMQPHVSENAGCLSQGQAHVL